MADTLSFTRSQQLLSVDLRSSSSITTIKPHRKFFHCRRSIRVDFLFVDIDFRTIGTSLDANRTRADRRRKSFWCSMKIFSNFLWICFQVGCLEGIHALVNALTPKTIRAFFHHQFDEFRLLIHFFHNPFVLHDLNNLQLLLDIVKVLFRSKSRAKRMILFRTDRPSIFFRFIWNPNRTFRFNVIGKSFSLLNQVKSNIVFIASNFFLFLLFRILSLFACAIEDIQPSSTPASKINFPSIQTSPKSFKKRSETSKDDSSKTIRKIELFVFAKAKT